MFDTNKRIGIHRGSILAVVLGFTCLFTGGNIAEAENTPAAEAGYYFVQQQHQQKQRSLVLHVSQSDTKRFMVSMDVENELLIDVLHRLADEIGVDISIDTGVINDKRLSYRCEDKYIFEVLSDLLKGTGLEAALGDDRKVVVIQKGEETKKGKLAETITGTVTDASTGQTMPGVNVVLKGTTTGTSTDSEGTYELVVPSLQDTLVFSFIGYQTLEVPINERTEINVSLTPQAIMGEEMVVVGYGIQKKASLTASISTLDNEELVQSPASNISNALVGRLPGLIAIQASGEPGYDQAQIRIRGIGTLREGAESAPLILVDGVARNMWMLSPQEVESISILKDAAATALYGVRGANGVILVTTKTGERGAPQISITGNFGLQSPTRLPELLNSYDYARLKNEALINDGHEPYFSERDLELFKNGNDPYFHPSIDWYDMVLKDYSMQQQHNVSISGGTDRTNYFISLGYFNQEGAYNNSHFNPDYDANAQYQRYNFRTNFDIDLTDNFHASIKLGGQLGEQNFPGQSAAEIFFAILKTNPMGNPGIIDGKLIRSVEGAPGGANPFLNILTTGYVRNFDRNLNTNIALEYDLDVITEGLTVRGMIAYDSWYRHQVNRGKPIETYSIEKSAEDPTEAIFIKNSQSGPFSFDESYDRWRKTYSEWAIEHVTDFGPHSISSLVLFNFEKRHDPDLAYNVPAAYLGLVSRIKYGYDDRYLTEFNMGYNGSENFPEGNRFGFFPSVSLGWIASNESFFPENNVFTFLKFRGSYGEVGNDQLGEDRFMYLPSVYNYAGGYHFGEVGQNYQWYGGSQEGQIGNPVVTWERARKLNLGIEFGFFDGRFNLNGDYFVERRDNILWNLGTVPVLVQADLPPVNIGKVINRGFEIYGTLRGNITDNLTYWVKGNYSMARNKIQYMDEPDRAYSWLRRTGKPVGQFFGLNAIGFYNTEEELANRAESAWSGNNLQLGDIKYEDLNGDGKINTDDMGPIGYSTFPQITYGFSLGGAYKGFDFSVLFQGAAKVSRYFREMAVWPFNVDWRAAMEWHKKRWTPERYAQGKGITFPRLSSSPTGSQHNYVTSDFWLRDASYLRLKNAEIGYTFSAEALSRLGMKNLRIYANGMNLFTWSKMKNFDPEAPTGRGEFYPQMIVYNFGFNINF